MNAVVVITVPMTNQINKTMDFQKYFKLTMIEKDILNESVIYQLYICIVN